MEKKSRLLWVNPIIFCLVFSFSSDCYSYQNVKPTVNILTWWGYLDDKARTSAIEKKCNVSLSFDEYYTNNEFLRRKNQDDYDILIFSNTIYKVIENSITRNNINLAKIAIHYNPVIKQKYYGSKFPPNVIFFVHALTGFLWNPNVININEKDSVFDIFNKANSNLVVILDEPFEAAKLLSLGLNKNNDFSTALTMENFRNVTQSANIYINNNYTRIYNNPNFAFSFTWSGEAFVDRIKSGKKFNFLIHPKLSYISTDLLAQLNNKRSVTCVSEELTSKNIMDMIQNKDYYFSSYGDDSNINDLEFKKIYEKFLVELPHLRWMDEVNKDEFYIMSQTWDLIKIKVKK